MKKNSYITVTDQFCGAGGSSQGVRDLSRSMGGGLEVKLALNHWKLAIETHNTNFPDTLHDCTDISAADPRRYPKTNILITSPECTNHSLAKGKKRKNAGADLFTSLKPEEERSRATMWDVPRFAEYHDYELIIVENVVDARYWVQWEAWLMAMHLLGYKHRCVYLNSMFCHPTPQSRDRMYIVFWKKGNPAPDLEYRPVAWCGKCEKEVNAVQVWRNSQKQWGKYKQQYDYRCTCGTVVEPFFFAAFNCIDWTIPSERIGDRTRPLAPNTIKRIEYGLKKYGKDPLIITTRYTSGVECRVKRASGEPLPTQPGDASHAILHSFIVKSGFNHPPKGVEESLRSVTTQHDTAIVQPFIINTDHSKSDKCFDRSAAAVMRSQTTAHSAGIIVPFIVENNGTSKAKAIGDRMPCVTGQAKHGIVNAPFLVKNYGGNNTKVEVTDPLGTITQQDHHGLVNAPVIVTHNGKSQSHSATDRLGCVSTRDRYGLLTPESFSAFMAQYYNGSNVANGMDEPARTVSTMDRAGLVVHQLKEPKLNDCTYRMLKPHEIQAAMAFEKDYIVLGNSRDKVKQLGNAVTPPAMRFLLDRCIQTLKKSAA
jgi:DNA (cytosine-5)-methyltransferase 1